MHPSEGLHPTGLFESFVATEHRENSRKREPEPLGRSKCLPGPASVPQRRSKRLFEPASVPQTRSNGLLEPRSVPQGRSKGLPEPASVLQRRSGKAVQACFCATDALKWAARVSHGPQGRPKRRSRNLCEEPVLPGTALCDASLCVTLLLCMDIHGFTLVYIIYP